MNPSHLSARARLRFLARDSLVYGGAAAFSRAFSLVSFPIVARHFSIAEFGTFDYMLMLAGLIATLTIFGQDSGVARYFYEDDAKERRAQLISQSLMVQLATSGLTGAVLWVCAEAVSRLLVTPVPSEGLVRIIAAQLPFLVASNFSMVVLRCTFSRAKFLVMSIGMSFAQAGGLVVAITIFDVGVRGAMVVSLVTSATFGGLGLLFIRDWLQRPVGLRFVKQTLPYALPIGAVCCASAFAPTLERTLTDRMLGADALGLYAAGAKVALLLSLAAGAFQTAWGPFSLSIYRQPDAAHTYNQVLRLFALGICVFVLGLSLLGGLIILVLASDRYSGASVVVFPLAMGLAVQATSWITEVGIGLSKRSYLSLFGYVTSLGISLGAIWLLAPMLGLVGVGLGVLLGHLAKAIVASWLAQRAYPLPWSYTPVVVLMTATIAVGLVAAWLGQRFGDRVQAVTIAACIPVIAVAGWKLLFTARERGAMRELVTRRLGSMIRRA